jgi:hypothetical protein
MASFERLLANVLSSYYWNSCNTLLINQESLPCLEVRKCMQPNITETPLVHLCSSWRVCTKVCLSRTVLTGYGDITVAHKLTAIRDERHAGRSELSLPPGTAFTNWKEHQTFECGPSGDTKVWWASRHSLGNQTVGIKAGVRAIEYHPILWTLSKRCTIHSLSQPSRTHHSG